MSEFSAVVYCLGNPHLNYISFHFISRLRPETKFIMIKLTLIFCLVFFQPLKKHFYFIKISSKQLFKKVLVNDDYFWLQM